MFTCSCCGFFPCVLDLKIQTVSPFSLQASPILNVMPYFLEYASGALKRKRV
jgi:hypothetical protein